MNLYHGPPTSPKMKFMNIFQPIQFVRDTDGSKPRDKLVHHSTPPPKTPNSKMPNTRYTRLQTTHTHTRCTVFPRNQATRCNFLHPRVGKSCSPFDVVTHHVSFACASFWLLSGKKGWELFCLLRCHGDVAGKGIYFLKVCDICLVFFAGCLNCYFN